MRDRKFRPFRPSRPLSGAYDRLRLGRHWVHVEKKLSRVYIHGVGQYAPPVYFEEGPGGVARLHIKGLPVSVETFVRMVQDFLESTYYLRGPVKFADLVNAAGTVTKAHTPEEQIEA